MGMLDEAQPPAASNRGRRSFLRRWDFRLSIASNSSTTTSTILPQYSAVADDELDSDVLSPSQDDGGVGSDDLNNSNSASFPPRYSVIHPPRNLEVTLRPPSGFYDEAEAIPQPYDFQYSCPIKSTKPWAALYLRTRDAVPGNARPLPGRPKVPRIWGCEPISGMLQLDLDSPLTIQQINIIVKGRVEARSALNEGSFKFLDYEFNLWDASDGGFPGDNIKGKFDGTLLSGNHSLPFYLPFPNEVDPSLEPTTLSDNPAYLPTSPDYSSRGDEHRITPFPSLSKRIGRSASGTQPPKKQSIPSPPVQRISDPPPRSVTSSMPQTFMEKGVTATVNYQLSVRFIHGRFKPDSKITTNICYIPASQPRPSSQKRRQAYEAGALIPGPMSDPDGWFNIPNVSVDGIFRSVLGPRQCTIHCKCYVAQPLSYTRGTVIPCFLTLSSNDSEVLDSVSNPDIPVLKLIRRLRHFAMAEDEHEPPLMSSSDFISSHKGLLHKTVHHEVATATWWVPPEGVPQETHVRHMEGEIHLNPDLQPSCSSQVFHVEYFVQLFALQSAEFEQMQSAHASSSGDRALVPTVVASLSVEITTLFRLDEPLPIPFTEPLEMAMRRVSCDGADAETMLPCYFGCFGTLANSG